MSYHKIGIIGATGNLGPAVLKALLDAGFEVTVLTREGSNSTETLASHPKQTIAKVNFSDVSSITSALKGVDGLVANLASHALLTQKVIIDGAIAAGVKRYLPSNFGSDMSVPANQTVPFNAPKHEIGLYLVDKVKSHPEFSYTFVSTGPFFDWSLNFGIFGDLKKHHMTLWDGGDTKMSTTTLASVGKAVVGIFKNSEATKNKDIRVQDTVISQRDIMRIAKEIDGKEWTTEPGNTDDVYQKALEESKKPKPDMMTTVMGQLFRILFHPGYGNDYSDRLDNETVGLSIMTDEQVKDVVKSALA